MSRPRNRRLRSITSSIVGSWATSRSPRVADMCRLPVRGSVGAPVRRGYHRVAVLPLGSCRWPVCIGRWNPTAVSPPRRPIAVSTASHPASGSPRYDVRSGIVDGAQKHARFAQSSTLEASSWTPGSGGRRSIH